MIVVGINNQTRGEVSMNTITVGVDLAQHVFAVCVMNVLGQVKERVELRREAFARWLQQLPAGTVVAMEACSSAHYWGRFCMEHGLQPRLMAAQFVTPFRKSRGIKNDRNDAEAIATAARQGNMRFVQVKSVEQQARLAWHRVREGLKVENLAVMNRLRGLLAEFGIVMAKTPIALRRGLAQVLERTDLPMGLLELIELQRMHWRQIQDQLWACDERIEASARGDERCMRLRALTGVGPLTADATVATVGDGRDFKNGRHLAAWRGLVPRQHSSGGHDRLGHISRSGDGYLRTVLIQGARSSAQQARRVLKERATPEQIWITQLAARMSFGKLLVAIANKHARQLWAMLARGDAYDPHAADRYSQRQMKTPMAA
jgi:transposase